MSDSLEAQLRRLSIGNDRGRGGRGRTGNTTKGPSSGAGVAATPGRSRRSKAKGGDKNTTTTTQALRPVKGNGDTNGGRVKKTSKNKKSKRNSKGPKPKRTAKDLSTAVRPDDLHAALEQVLKEGAAPKFETRLEAAMFEAFKSLVTNPDVIVKDFATDLHPASTPHPGTPVVPKRHRKDLRLQAQGSDRPNNEEEQEGDVEMADA